MSEQDKPDSGTDNSPAGSEEKPKQHETSSGAEQEPQVAGYHVEQGAETSHTTKHTQTTRKKAKKKKAKTSGKSANNARQQPEHQTAQPRQSGSSAGGGISWLAVIALLLIGVTGYGILFNYQKQQQAGTISLAQAADHADLVKQVDELSRQLQAAQSQDRELIDALKNSDSEQKVVQSTIRKSIGNLSAQLAKKGRGPLKWRIAEVDYLLSVANHSVILERNVETASKALIDADERLEAISDPALISVRRKIASEITALKSVELPDISGMSATLRSLVDGIERLPLINKERVFDRETPKKEETVKDWDELPAAMWKDIKSLVTVRRNMQPVERLLPPEEKHYLYQNLGLKLEEARIALLQRETVTFKTHLTDTREWVQRYFDPESAAVTTVVNTIGTLVTAELDPALPDISGSLRDLRRWGAGNNRARLPKPAKKKVVKAMPKKKPQQHEPRQAMSQPAASPGLNKITAEPTGAAKP